MQNLKNKMFEDLRKNILQEKSIIGEIRKDLEEISKNPGEKELYLKKISSLMRQLEILNNAVPELLKKSSLLKSVLHKQATKKEQPKKILPMSYTSNKETKEKGFISIDKKDRHDFLKQLKLSDDALKKIQKKKKSKPGEIKKANPFVRVSNKCFRKVSEKLSPNFKGLESDLQKANMRFLLKSYISLALFSSTIAFFVGLLGFLAMLTLNFSNFIFFWIPFACSALVFAGFYLYPASEASSVQKSITQEIPFATIHMTAIAGSDIEPSKIFKIVVDSNEYPAIGTEIRKILVQIQIYGYDLVTSLKNVASRTPNEKLAELFAGFSTNISTGGNLKNYLEQKAESYLLDYRLEREKYTQLAGTFMDIYISILIAAPLVLMMMFIVINVSGLGVGGLSIQVLLFLSIAGIAFMNILFLFVLNLKQPKS